ncbi:MAG: quinone-dependent dihydroorotate dehydrogenase [Chloroflexi bacterium]|nr:quinone-dependent dihydroorotate dehydrogenase [Chloroflexota bacterium]
MDLYPLARPALFALDPERAHGVVLDGLDLAHRAGLVRGGSAEAGPALVMGLRFPNRVGLAAGLDKNGEHLDGLATLGFGFLEVGTVTPRPQPGNPRPRLFRIPAARALVNRMGFNNGGAAALVRNVERSRFRGVLGISIGKNAATPATDAIADYVACLDAVYAHAGYIAINVSSPNTSGLRALQAAAALDALLEALASRRAELAARTGRRVPFAVKIAPYLEPEQLRAIAAVIRARADAAIATNTTIDHAAVAHLPYGGETGGLSGAPLRDRALEVVRFLARELGDVPIIGSGGIMSAADGRRMREAGASLVQVYTGLIYRGPSLVRELARELAGT